MSPQLERLHPEGPLARYKRLVSGPTAGWGRFLAEEAVLGAFSRMPGALGLVGRALFYRFILGAAPSAALVDRGVTLRCPSRIHLGQGVILESDVQLLATSTRDHAISLGAGSYVRSYSVLSAGPPDGYIRIGANSTVAHHCVIHGHGGVTIGNDVMIAARCSLVASMHVHDRTDVPMSRQGFTAQGITIGDDVWLGTGVTVLDGVRIGQGSIVGAGSVVLGDLPPYTISAGVPCTVRKNRKEGLPPPSSRG